MSKEKLANVSSLRQAFEIYQRKVAETKMPVYNSPQIFHEINKMTCALIEQICCEISRVMISTEKRIVSLEEDLRRERQKTSNLKDSVDDLFRRLSVLEKRAENVGRGITPIPSLLDIPMDHFVNKFSPHLSITSANAMPFRKRYEKNEKRKEKRRLKPSLRVPDSRNSEVNAYIDPY